MATTKKHKGPRPPHTPQRTCVACRRTDNKRTLTRIVRDAEGHITIDITGKKAGRGAYLCTDPQCWELALRRNGLERALKISTVYPEDRTALEAYAQALSPIQENQETK